MEFRCRLATPAGEIIEGVYPAESEARLRHDFEQRGLCVLSLKPRRAIAGFALELPRRRGIPEREFLMFNQELATLLKAGMPLVQSLDILRPRVTHPVFKPILDDVHGRVRAGTSLSEAFAEHGDVFPGVYVASLLAGERSGSLETTIRRFVSYAQVIAGVKRRTRSALVYPAILMALALVVVGIIVFRVVPEFGQFYEAFDAELPFMTQVILAVSTTIRDRFPIVAIVAAAAAGAVAIWLRQPGQRAAFDGFVLRVPWAGAVARKFATSQLARTLATLLGGGLPLVSAIDVAARSIGNRFMAAQFAVVRDRVREGAAFAEALEERGVFPAVAVRMAEVGESTGALQEMLNSVADFYDEEIETDLARFVTMVEPVLLVVMGLVIAALLIALYLPLVNLTAVVGQ